VQFFADAFDASDIDDGTVMIDIGSEAELERYEGLQVCASTRVFPCMNSRSSLRLAKKTRPAESIAYTELRGR
jgi:hypothetical protein